MFIYPLLVGWVVPLPWSLLSDPLRCPSFLPRTAWWCLTPRTLGLGVGGIVIGWRRSRLLHYQTHTHQPFGHYVTSPLNSSFRPPSCVWWLIFFHLNSLTMMITSLVIWLESWQTRSNLLVKRKGGCPRWWGQPIRSFYFFTPRWDKSMVELEMIITSLSLSLSCS